MVQLQNYSAYFRELDFDVFTILHTELLTKSVLDTEMHTKASRFKELWGVGGEEEKKNSQLCVGVVSSLMQKKKINPIAGLTIKDKQN